MTETKPCGSAGCPEILTRRPGEYDSRWDARSYHSTRCGRWGVWQPETKRCELSSCGAVFERPARMHRDRWGNTRFCCAEHGGGTRCGPRKPPPPPRTDTPRPATKRILPTPVSALPSWRPAGFRPQPPIGVAS